MSLLSNEIPNTTLYVHCGMVFFIVFLLLGFLFVPKFLYERKQTKETSECCGEKILCQKTREELIAKVTELESLLFFESEGLAEPERMVCGDC